ncbi:MAG: hemolysin family protein [Treponema sp.]|jgi:CBS domain containing-hemolysin-like protein|nr:hemolysin family protein [Treponema sp.]
MSAASFFHSLFHKKDEIDSKTYRTLETDQREMIRGVVELSDTTVKEVMVPRIDTVFLDADSTREELLALIAGNDHSRYPVYQDTIDNVIGILYVKDVLQRLIRGEELDIRGLVRRPFFVPESKHIDDLLKELRRRKVHIAVAVDEYGGVSGIVCMENIIEEIIGDIQDEFDHEAEELVELGEGSWLCDARINLEDLTERLGDKLPPLPVEDFETLGGFVFDLFGKIPVKHEKVTWEGVDFIVQDMEGHKINTVRISAHAAA